MAARLGLLALCAAVCAGCGLFGNSPDGGTQPSGFGTPTLEVTVNGVHAGPVAPDGTSAASLNDVYDATTGNLAQSTLSLSATATSVNAGCSMALQRYGAVAPLGVGEWALAETTGSASGDGQAAPLGAPTVSLQGVTLSCNGDGCADTALTVSALDSAHLEGYFSGSFSDANGDVESVVCSFYLAVNGYTP